jgi:hypothetical protein
MHPFIMSTAAAAELNFKVASHESTNIPLWGSQQNLISKIGSIQSEGSLLLRIQNQFFFQFDFFWTVCRCGGGCMSAKNDFLLLFCNNLTRSEEDYIGMCLAAIWNGF